MTDLLANAHGHLARCNIIAAVHGIDPVQAQFQLNGRFKRLLGDALLTVREQRIGRIRFCRGLLQEWKADACAEVMTHEIAHLFAALEHPTGASHGACWRYYMELFGYPDARATISICRKV